MEKCIGIWFSPRMQYFTVYVDPARTCNLSRSSLVSATPIVAASVHHVARSATCPWPGFHYWGLPHLRAWWANPDSRRSYTLRGRSVCPHVAVWVDILQSWRAVFLLRTGLPSHFPAARRSHSWTPSGTSDDDDSGRCRSPVPTDLHLSGHYLPWACTG